MGNVTHNDLLAAFEAHLDVIVAAFDDADRVEMRTTQIVAWTRKPSETDATWSGEGRRVRPEIIAQTLERTPFAGLDADELRELARLLAKALTTSSGAARRTT